MRIGLLTYYWEDNPGQFFQALATVQVLRRVFPDAAIEIPDIRHWTQKCNPVRRRDILRPWRIVSRIRGRVAYNAARQRLPICGTTVVTHDPTVAISAIRSRCYDLLVVGSDIVLQLLDDQRVMDELPPFYWLVGLDNQPRAMLGSSCGSLHYEDLSGVQRHLMRLGLREFQLIAIRDELTAELLRSLGTASVPIRMTPDPTFAYDMETVPAVRPGSKLKHNRQKPVCGIFFPWKYPFLDELVERLSQDFDVVDIHSNHRNCRNLPGLGPFEWCRIFPSFDLHVTASFHDAVFCLKQGVPVFSVEGNPGRFDNRTWRSKSSCLMDAFGLLETNYFNPFRPGTSVESVRSRITTNWQRFDSNFAREHSRALGYRYIEMVEALRSVVGESIVSPVRPVCSD